LLWSLPSFQTEENIKLTWIEALLNRFWIVGSVIVSCKKVIPFYRIGISSGVRCIVMIGQTLMMQSPLSENNPFHPPSNRNTQYPFSLSTTSFIYPAGWAENVARLGRCFDEIELLFFESRYAGSLPSKREIRHLVQQADEHNIRYNIHLPVDIHLGAVSRQQRRRAVEALKKVFTLTAALPVSTHTLHLTNPKENLQFQSVRHWQERIYDSLTQLLTWGVEATTLSIENIDYPFDWVAPIVDPLELAVCLDIGHLLNQGFDLEDHLSRWGPQVTIVHLHGATLGQDHLALDRLPNNHRQTVMTFLSGFQGVVSLEVFNIDRLKRSVACLDKWWRTRAE
jgi:sugar phosphate isomerase/epimerase